MLFRSRRSPLAALLGVGFTILAASAAMAETAPVYSVLLAESQSRAPRLTVAGASVDQAKGLAEQARAYPNPSASTTVENFQGTRGYRGFSMAETTISLSQPFELWGKRNARIRAGDAGVGAAEARQRQAFVDYAADLAILYAQAEAASRRLLLAQETQSLASQDLRIAQSLVNAGRESNLRLLQAMSAATAANAEIEAARGESAGALSRLSAMTGTPAPYTAVADNLLARPAVVRDAQEVDIANVPSVLSAEAAREAASLRVQAERTKWQPDITASIGARRFSADNSSALIAGVSIPLPIWDQNSGNVNAAMGELRSAEAQLAIARLDAQAALRTFILQLSASEARVQAATEAEAAANQAYQLSRTGYQAGSIPLVELTTAQRGVATARNALVEAQIARVRAEAELSRLQGRAPFGG